MLFPSFSKKSINIINNTIKISEKGLQRMGRDFTSPSLSLSCFVPPTTICSEALVPFACAALWVVFSMTSSCPVSIEIP